MKTQSLFFVLCIMFIFSVKQDAFAQTSWELTGNAATNSNTNFVGTTDNKSLGFRTKNIQRAIISKDGNVGINTPSPLQKLHVKGNINMDSSYGLYLNNIRVLHTSGLTTWVLTQTNFFAGQYAGNAITDGFWNAALGCNALLANTSGGGNTATGYNALYSNTSGGNNVANGTDALHSNTTGPFNTATGALALFYNTTGSNNTAVGFMALENNTNGQHNTAVGVNAMETNTTGDHNTAIGYNADVSSANLSNATAIGYNASVTASNQVRIGNSSVTSIGGFANWSNVSDGRVKKNMKTDVPGLAFIKKLKPVTYNLDLDAADKITKSAAIKTKDDKSTESDNARKTKEQVIHSGFVAQDVERAANELGYNFSGVDAPKNDKDLYGLRYSEFVVPLVKAVQELSAENDELKSRLAKIEQLLAHDQQEHGATLSDMRLEQNAPNPFNQRTVINYYLPLNAGKATINITDMNGTVIKTFGATAKGNGQLVIEAGRLSPGTYQYSLVVNGKTVEAKKMMLLK